MRCTHFTWCLLLLIFLLLFRIFVEPTSQKRDYLLGARAVCWSSCQRWQWWWWRWRWRWLVVIANIDAINTEARSETNAKKQHSKSWKCNDCNNICDTNVKSFWIFCFNSCFDFCTPRHVACRKENRCIKKSNSLPWKRQKMMKKKKKKSKPEENTKINLKKEIYIIEMLHRQFSIFVCHVHICIVEMYTQKHTNKHMCMCVFPSASPPHFYAYKWL